MIAVVRIILLVVFFLCSTLAGLLICIVRPFHANNVFIFSHWYGWAAWIFCIKVELRKHQGAHIAAAALEAVRSQAQTLGVGSLLCLAQPQQALLGVEQKGIQQDRILILHDVLQGRQHVAI